METEEAGTVITGGTRGDTVIGDGKDKADPL